MGDAGSFLSVDHPGPQFDRPLAMAERLPIGGGVGEGVKRHDRPDKRPRLIVGVVGMDGEVSDDRWLESLTLPDQRFEVVGQPGMEQRPLGRQQFVVRRFAQERVAEGVGGLAVVIGRDEDPGLDRVSQRTEQGVIVHAGDGGEALMREPAADHRRRTNHRDRRGRERCQTQIEDVSERRRDPLVLAPILRDQLLDIEGDPIGPFEQRIDEMGRWRNTEDPEE